MTKNEEASLGHDDDEDVEALMKSPYRLFLLWILLVVV
jgi:hypothetical protein